MRTEELIDALNLLDEELVEATDRLRRSQDRRWRTAGTLWTAGALRYGALAACLCLMFLAVFSMASLLYREKGTTEGIVEECAPEAAMEEAGEGADGEKVGFAAGSSMSGGAEGTADGSSGVTIPTPEVNLQKSDVVMADMLAFFIYEGRLYVEYELIEKPVAFVGEQLGTAVGLIDEWTPQEGYVELAGSVSGDFYTVDGYDPEFMLCMPLGDFVQVFVNRTGITLTKGAELFEEKLQLDDNYATVEYQTRYDWNNTTGVFRTLEGEALTVLEQFEAALMEASFMESDRIPLEQGDRNIYDRELYHLYYRMENGMTVHLRLLEDGYVLLKRMEAVCVQVDEAVYEKLLAIMGETS